MEHRDTKRAIQARETKNRIGEEAMKLFDRKGIENVTIAEIAEAAGCSPGNFYHYYKSKGDILADGLKLLDESYLEAADRINTEEPFRSMDSAQKFAEFFCETIRICSEGSYLHVYYLNGIREMEKKALQYSDTREYFRICEDFLREMQVEGLLCDDLDVKKGVDMLLVLVRGILMEWVVNDRNFDPVARARFVMDHMISGFLR